MGSSIEIGFQGPSLELRLLSGVVGAAGYVLTWFSYPSNQDHRISTFVLYCPRSQLNVPMTSRCVFTILIVVLSGCAPWETATWKTDQWQIGKPDSLEDSDFKLPANRLSPGSIVMEIAVGQLDVEQQTDIESLWHRADVQSLSLSTRKKFDQNGIRLGIVGSQIPGVLNRLLEDKAIDTDGMLAWQKEFVSNSQNKTIPRLILHQQIQNNEGETHATPLSDPIPQASWVIQIGAQSSAGQGENVRGYLCFRTYPNGDGGVRLVVYPEIRLGQMRSKIGVENDTFLFQAEQTARKIDDLRFEVNLQPGETLLMGPNASMSGLGQLFFGASESAQFYQRLVMIRLVQSQRNDLFEAESSYSF